jgi:hypothetical protein
MKRFREKLSPFLVRAGETLLAVGCVLVFFLGFMAILGASFPQGTGLADLLQSSSFQEGNRTSRFDFNLGSRPGTAPYRESFVALLTDVSRKVKDKPPSAISWSPVQSDRNLQDRHAVQTFERSGATIVFDARNHLRLAGSSLVIVRRLEREPARRARRASLVVLDGELSGRITRSDDEDSMTLEIVTGDATSTIRSERADPTDFRVSSEDGAGATLDIYQGVAEVTSAGRTVEVPAFHSVTIEPGLPPSKPVRLPEPPRPETPAAGSVHPYATVRPEVDFSWSADPDAEGWLLEIARDRKFEDLIHVGDVLSVPELVHGQLPDGEIYWRVRATKGAARGPYSETRELSIVKDETPPELSVEIVDDPQADGRLIVRGTTEPGTEIYVAKQPVTVDAKGRFTTVVRVDHGMRRIVVEAFDAVGNVAYRSEPIDTRYVQ